MYPSGEYPGIGDVEPPGGPLIGAEPGIAADPGIDADEGAVLDEEAPGGAGAPGGGGGAPVELLATVDEPPPSPPQPAR